MRPTHPPTPSTPKPSPPPGPGPGRLFSVETVAEQLDVSKATVYSLIHAGSLSAHYIGTGKRPRVRISESALAEFIRASAA
jgi:excisionase family DNA binding protein